MTDRHFAHYRLEEEIGRGGMGVVYRAHDTRLGRPVAIKVLPPEATTDADRRRRFIQEARAASALNHPNIVTIHEIDEDDGTTFIVMELVEGAPLDRLIAKGPLPLVTAANYAIQVSSALEAAHASGIVHRDIKPANIVVTPDGRVKVLDFGLAKLMESHPGPETTMTALGTGPGLILGTAAYMSPEQAEGRPIDRRSDLFSFGAVLYEMLAGRRPFHGESGIRLLSAILRDPHVPLREVRSETPSALERIVDRCLQKDPAARFQDAGALRAALVEAHATLTRPPDAAWRRPAVLVPVALLLLAGAGFGVWQAVQARNARWARLEVLPEIERLQRGPESLEAYRLARRVERYAPEEVEQVRNGWLRFRFTTDPSDAQVEIKNYLDIDGPWELLGRTPIVEAPLPFGQYRLRLTKPGYRPLEISTSPGLNAPLRLPDERSTPVGMVLVPGGPYRIGVTSPVRLPDFWIDQFEVTNREFKRFVDAGGYRDPKYWIEPFVDGDRVLNFDEAMARFRDATGRSGPSTWELASHPEGQDDYPVAGISWFEAAAYARFADRSLPSLFHWFRASGAEDPFSDVLQASNFDGKGPIRVGESRGVGPWGTLDMAGNVKEWCRNLATGTGKRYILGAGWDEPSYRFRESDAQDPWERRGSFGVRLVKDSQPAEGLDGPVGRVYGDPKSLVPVDDREFEAYRRFYAYDRTSLDSTMDASDDRSPHWRLERVSFNAAYGGERIPAFLFRPKNTSPPYQTIVLFPSAFGRMATTSRNLDLSSFDFIVRSGRALLYPIYQGTFERRGQEAPGPAGMRDLQVQWAKDFFRAVDYLETRDDIDMNRLGYYSLSMGAYFGPIPVSLEPRVKLAIFVAGGLRFNSPPEIQPANFMPRVTVPVLLLNGRDDFANPPEAQQRFLELLGTPAEHKRHAPLEGGHVPTDMRRLVREVVDWLDKYFGPVNPRHS